MILLLLVANLVLSLGQYTPNLKLYKSTQEIYQWFQSKQTNHPELIKTHKCPQDEGIRYFTYGNTSRDVKVMINCGIHARELITSDTCVSIFNEILKNQDSYQDMFLTVVPVANKMRERVLAGQTWRRVNENEVDPNRNFDIEWEKGNNQNGSETFHGLKPMSQKSSQCLDGILTQNHYNLFIDIHTGQFSIFYAQNPNNPSFTKSTEMIASEIQRRFCPHCVKSTVMRHHGIRSGELFQYASKVKKVDHSFLLQMFGGKFSYSMMGRYKGCMKQFNPNSERTRDYYINQWTRIVIRMINRVIGITKRAKSPRNHLQKFQE